MSMSSLSLPRALLYGHLLITLPILAGFVLVLLVPFLFVQVWEGQPSWFVLAWLGLLLVWTLAGWIWWALTLPRWRLWALRRVEDPRALRRWAVLIRGASDTEVRRYRWGCSASRGRLAPTLRVASRGWLAPIAAHGLAAEFDEVAIDDRGPVEHSRWTPPRAVSDV